MAKRNNNVRKYRVEVNLNKYYMESMKVNEQDMQEEKLKLYTELLSALPPKKLDTLFNFNVEDVDEGREIRLSAYLII